MARSIFDSYLAGAADAFFTSHFARAEDRRRAVELARRRPLADSVRDALEAQNAAYAPSRARAANLDALFQGAAAVVTGQQVGLFLGPLYTVYKAASAIVVARVLAEEQRTPVVPVFWLQTEDHDLAEIAEHWVPAALDGSPRALRLPASPNTPDAPDADRISIAHRALPAELAEVLGALSAELAGLPYAAEHLAHLARHYQPGASWERAFAGVLAELFADEGLILIAPRDPALARAAAPIHRRAIEDAVPIARALLDRVHALEAAGFEAPVHIREEAPLSFFHPRGAEGPRYRTAAARDELLRALDADPRAFSTSALLRPILQDSLLPTAAYVGGPGELAYFAQLAPLYAAYQLPMPLLVPRARFRVVEEKIARLLEKRGLSADDVAQKSEDALLARAADAGLTRALPEPDQLSRELLSAFTAKLEEAAPALAAAGPGLDTALEKTRATVEHAVSKLIEKYARARLHRDRDAVAEVRRLKAHLHPNGAPQERVYGLSYFAARYGERAFVERVLRAIVPFDPAPRDLA